MSFVAEQSPNIRRKQDVEGRVNDAPRDNFMFFYHPAEWCIDHRGRLMPAISHVSKAPGCGAVGADGNFDAQQLALTRRGYIPIDHEILGEGTDYVTPYRNRKGKMVCRSAFQVPYAAAEGVTKWRFDEEAWDAFVALLRKRGIIKRPKPEVLRGLLEQQKERRDFRIKRRPRTDDAAALERYNAEVARLQAAIALLETEIVDSEREYGKEPAPARLRVLELLEAELDDNANPDADATVAPATPAPKKGKGGRKPKLAVAKPPREEPGGLVADPPADPGDGPDADDDEEVD